MHLSTSEATRLVGDICEKLKSLEEKVAVAVCPPFVHLAAVREFLKNARSGPQIALGAQNIHWEKSGAFTGEISGNMLSEIGCRYVIIGHSERRHIFLEDDAMVAKKVAASFQYGLLPIICVGETLGQREGGETLAVVQTQLLKALQSLSNAQIEASTIAYEPVWAIGTGKAATPEMAQEIHKMIRDTLAREYGQPLADNVRIQYGGSVTPANIKSLIAQPDIDGALVGGASLKADSFAEIVIASAKAGK